VRDLSYQEREFEKKKVTAEHVHPGSAPLARSLEDLQSASGLGMGATRAEERLMCAFGFSAGACIVFEKCQSIAKGGVMLLLPFLLECGLLSYCNHFHQRLKGYYNFDNLFIIIAFIYLLRIKSFEQVKHHSPGELGKLVGYDRIPEVNTLRGMVHEITAQKRTDQWAASLAKTWIEEEEPELYYIDGHVQVYHGYLANLGKKHISGQRLCLPGMMEFWVNSGDGSPYFFITADVNEKMQEMLSDEIIPKLLELHPVSEERRKMMAECTEEPVFTLVFDREAYSPEFFARLWNQRRIAVITYRKNVKDHWDASLFQQYTVKTRLGDEQMQLCEQPFQPDVKSKGCLFREVRKLGANGHQTSIITTNQKITIQVIASNMFARWTQENYFRYMRQEYAVDKILQYSVDEIDGNIKVVNREYSNMEYQIKKEREKLGRKKAKLYDWQQKNPLEVDDENQNRKWLKTELKMIEEIKEMEEEIEKLVVKRKGIPCKIPISQMPESTRYNRLNQESKTLQNIIKMICYRAETALANILAPHYKRADNEIRALVKSITQTAINLDVDHQKELLTITLYPLANQRSVEAVSNICDTVNEMQTIYPGTNLKMCFKILNVDSC